ncbi:aldehyde dehydrogenase (NADP(+)) [Hydrocarboniphaga sp.]|uniref:aldehyde dehydrogenase (NADP(+)) n=1 Tax=Hydrocarboniphaga sp. TaxID=2033016 RepID=UPI003D105F89
MNNTSPTPLDAIDSSVQSAAATAVFWAESGPSLRAALLRGLADALDAARDELVAIADRESALGPARLNGEVARTSFQLRGFAAEVEAGVPYARVDDAAIAGAPPQGRPHLVRMLEPLGVVAMFSASNFPFAFSVLGGDTAAALAAGCPVVVKAHPGHPQLSLAVWELAQRVLERQKLPAGLISLVPNADREGGSYLVRHPDVAAVAFTGSYQGGMALQKLAAERPRPIPFYGELGSINPVVALPAKLRTEGAALAATLAGSITLGCGQFCTSPGVIVLIDDPASDAFVAALAEAFKPMPTHAMLSPAIRQGFDNGAAKLAAHAAVKPVFAPAADGAGPAPRLFEVTAEAFIADAHLREEVFGPLALVVRAADVGEAVRVLEAVGGTLTVTLWGLEQDSDDARHLLRAARRVAGRVLFAGVPTGVAVTHAQQHGGPWPSSTQPQSTSVGYAAMQRFLRPVALQDAPRWALETENGQSH